MVVALIGSGKREWERIWYRRTVPGVQLQFAFIEKWSGLLDINSDAMARHGIGARALSLNGSVSNRKKIKWARNLLEQIPNSHRWTHIHLMLYSLLLSPAVAVNSDWPLALLVTLCNLHTAEMASFIFIMKLMGKYFAGIVRALSGFAIFYFIHLFSWHRSTAAAAAVSLLTVYRMRDVCPAASYVPRRTPTNSGIAVNNMETRPIRQCTFCSLSHIQH